MYITTKLSVPSWARRAAGIRYIEVHGTRNEGSTGMPRDSNLPLRDWFLGHGPAMPRRQLVRLSLLLACPPALTALAFALRGYWHVLLFVLAEQAVLGAVLLHQLRRRTDYDRIVLSGNDLLIEQRRGLQRIELRLTLWSTRLAVDADERALIHFIHPQGDVELGHYTTLARRREVADELRRCLPVACLAPPEPPGPPGPPRRWH